MEHLVPIFFRADLSTIIAHEVERGNESGLMSPIRSGIKEIMRKLHKGSSTWKRIKSRRRSRRL